MAVQVGSVLVRTFKYDKDSYSYNAILLVDVGAKMLDSIHLKRGPKPF
jgi:hypothetical protein